MGSTVDQDPCGEAREKQPPRFGSYLGLVYVAAILGILSFAIFHDSGTSHAYDQLRPGMTPTQVAALLGVPGIETKSGTRIVQVWRIPDGFTIKVAFQEGRLFSKERLVVADDSREP